MLIGVGLLLAPLWSGCASNDNAGTAARLTPLVLAVPGVTGGTVDVSDTSGAVLVTCRLTGDATTQDGLDTTLDAVLRVVTSNTTGLRDGTMIACTVANAGLTGQASDLGLPVPTYLQALRARYG